MTKKYSLTKGPVSRIPRRGLGQLTTLQLYVAAGGVCEFPGCNTHVLHHPTTRQGLNHGELAHVVAFRLDGPRGKFKSRTKDINAVENLMLLCGACHRLIDRQPKDYPVHQLRNYKREHERRVQQAVKMAVADGTTTSVIRLVAPIGGNIAQIPDGHVRRAMFPNVMHERGCDMALTDFHGLNEDLIYERGCDIIRQRLQAFIASAPANEMPRHYSVFALGPIPLLIALGQVLGRDVPADVYNRQHDTDDWSWKASAPAYSFAVTKLHTGTTPDHVALLVPCSGPIDPRGLPSHIDGTFTIYEIRPDGCSPSKNVMRSTVTLAAFKQTYEEARRLIHRDHNSATTIHLFPVVPPAVAVTIGRELIAKVDPVLIVYDKRRTEYVRALEVNSYGRH